MPTLIHSSKFKYQVRIKNELATASVEELCRVLLSQLEPVDKELSESKFLCGKADWDDPDWLDNQSSTYMTQSTLHNLIEDLKLLKTVASGVAPEEVRTVFPEDIVPVFNSCVHDLRVIGNLAIPTTDGIRKFIYIN